MSMGLKIDILVVSLGVLAVYAPTVTIPATTALISTTFASTITRIQTLFNSAVPQQATTMSTTSAFPGLPAVPPNDPSLTAPANSSTPRKIKFHFEALEQAEGAGATVRRSVGTAKLRNLSPFLMLDQFSVAPGAGFPDHPHRGQETITYMLKGEVMHEDFAGNKGSIFPGDLQFMTAGRYVARSHDPCGRG